VIEAVSITPMVASTAIFRVESRGGHHRTDAPAPQGFWRRHTVQLRGRPPFTTPVGEG
jgi:L-aspartate oxidase